MAYASLSSHRAQLAYSAIISGVVVASTIFAYQKIHQVSKLKSLKDSIPSFSDSTSVSPPLGIKLLKRFIVLVQEFHVF